MDENGHFIEKTQKAFSGKILTKRAASKKTSSSMKKLKEHNEIQEEKLIALGESIFEGVSSIRSNKHAMPPSDSVSVSVNEPQHQISATSVSSNQMNITPRSRSESVDSPEIQKLSENQSFDVDDMDDNDYNVDQSKFLYFIPDGNFFFLFLQVLKN